MAIKVRVAAMGKVRMACMTAMINVCIMINAPPPPAC